MSQNVLDYIENGWSKCAKENRSDEETLIGLPYPYTVPAVGHFNEMYYWDTYFTNLGLIVSGRERQAKFNTDNMLYLVNKYSFVPNGNRTYFLDRSQPPFLSLMVKDVYTCFNDKVWLKAAYETLKTEYDFWMTKRLSSVGLNFYSTNLTQIPDEAKTEFFGRVGFEVENSNSDIGRHMKACCESGWDISPRFEYSGYNYAPVDLNSLMFMFEKNMAYFASELDDNDAGLWNKRSDERKERMLKYMDGADCLLFDYNFEKQKLSKVFSAASFYPLFAGLADECHTEAIIQNLHRLEAEYGILTCEKNDEPGNFQWSYPNGWACLQYIAMIGLDNYGYKAEALRIANKYIRLADKVFNETGNLWEKYNVIEGSINVVNEYKMPPMMGWSAGVYLAAKRYVGLI